MSLQNILGYLLWREVQLEMKLLRVDSWSVYEVVASSSISLVHLICNQLSFVVTASFIRHNTDVVTFPLCSVQKSVWVDQFAQLVTISSLPSVTKSLSVQLNIQAWHLFQVSETHYWELELLLRYFFRVLYRFQSICVLVRMCVTSFAGFWPPTELCRSLKDGEPVPHNICSTLSGGRFR